MTDTEAPEMSPQALIAYKTMLEQFGFLKKQQWATTNYLVLIYAAIIWYGQHVEHSPRLSCLLSAVAIAAGLITIGMLIWFQYDLGELRKGVQVAEAAYFSPEERQALGLKPYDHPYGRGWHVLAALILVCVFGAGLVVLALN
jgi:hypothetical protein